MEFQDQINQKLAFFKPESFEITEKSNNDFFEIGKEKINALAVSIDEIKFLINERQKLSDEIISEGEKLKSEIQSYLEINEKNSIGGTDVAKEKNDLRHKKIEISELQLNEKLNCWKDIATLKKELRIYERELSEKEQRVKSINKILEEN